MAQPLVKRRSLRWLVVAWVPRLLVAALFVFTGVTKIIDPEAFIEEVRQYEMVPLQLSNLLAYGLPWVEVFAALLLAIGLWRLEGRVVIAVMLVVFVAAKIYVIGILGRELRGCGCVPTDSLIHFLFDGWMGVVTNFGLLALLGMRRTPRRNGALAAETQQAVPA